MYLITHIYLSTSYYLELNECLKNKSLYLSRIEGPPPKRNAGGSNPPKDASTGNSQYFFIDYEALWDSDF